MRPHKHLLTLATATTAAAILAPAAHADPIDAGGGGGAPVATPHVVSAPARPSSSEWELIALASGGTVALIGAGLGKSRRTKTAAVTSTASGLHPPGRS